jgi:hypothetical protein
MGYSLSIDTLFKYISAVSVHENREFFELRNRIIIFESQAGVLDALGAV